MLDKLGTSKCSSRTDRLSGTTITMTSSITSWWEHSGINLKVLWSTMMKRTSSMDSSLSINLDSRPKTTSLEKYRKQARSYARLKAIIWATLISTEWGYGTDVIEKSTSHLLNLFLTISNSDLSRTPQSVKTQSHFKHDQWKKHR